MRPVIRYVAFVSALLLAAVPATAQVSVTPSIQLSFDADGKVNLAARNVTVREILAEWARQCGCYIINAERMPGGPLPTPIQFEHATQQAVLESLLRAAAGFALTPKRAGSSGVSNFETIYILATSSPVASAYVPPPATPTMMMPTPGAPDDELPPVVPAFNRADTPQGSAPPGPGSSPTPVPTPQQTPAARIGGVPSSFTPTTGAVPIVAMPPGQAPNTSTPQNMPTPSQMPTPAR